MNALTKRILSICLFTVVSVCVYAQCQNQTCSDTGTCFKCSDTTTSVGCLVSSCNSCSISRCDNGGVAPNQCEALPQHLSDLKPVSFGKQALPKISTSFAMLGEKGAPAELVSVNVSRDSVLRSIQLKNVSAKNITGYQLGWVFVSDSKPATVTLGPELRVLDPLPKDGIVLAPDHPLPSSFFEKTAETKKVGFFVAGVTFADGSSWKANLKQMEEGATASSQPGTQGNNKSHI